MRKPRRFDDALMEPPDALGAVDEALLASLRTWCEEGAFPVLTEPLRVASIAPHAGLDGAACGLDGSHELARMGRSRGLLWRVRILWRECVTQSGTQRGDPWDCGWWREGPLDAAEAFRPRRPTLLMVRETDPAVVAALLAALRANTPAFGRPVRVVAVSTAEAGPSRSGVYDEGRSAISADSHGPDDRGSTQPLWPAR
ncbi:hypothetical protein CDN99_06145 [Roseateles aquatilis]|uniref:Uncharacterized protein n=1 Tax=Roseateles aquatilis TaxID=431061 RepID=A0A246JH96_9BURK|nr:hypothetical protein [Roseateles aquatilis]OWQ91945.1 hypothetical protein CDN99_06145 [Roseateles aquatilis]